MMILHWKHGLKTRREERFSNCIIDAQLQRLVWIDRNKLYEEYYELFLQGPTLLRPNSDNRAAPLQSCVLNRLIMVSNNSTLSCSGSDMNLEGGNSVFRHFLYESKVTNASIDSCTTVLPYPQH